MKKIMNFISLIFCLWIILLLVFAIKNYSNMKKYSNYELDKIEIEKNEAYRKKRIALSNNNEIDYNYYNLKNIELSNIIRNHHRKPELNYIWFLFILLLAWFLSFFIEIEIKD